MHIPYILHIPYIYISAGGAPGGPAVATDGNNDANAINHNTNNKHNATTTTTNNNDNDNAIIDIIVNSNIDNNTNATTTNSTNNTSNNNDTHAYTNTANMNVSTNATCPPNEQRPDVKTNRSGQIAPPPLSCELFEGMYNVM